MDQTFSPKQLGLSEDKRNLGLAIIRVELVDVNLPTDMDLAADGAIDLGTQGARKHLGPCWSVDEQSEGVTFVWTDGHESLLWASFLGPSDYEVEMRLLPFCYPGVPPQELKLYVNGHHLQDIFLKTRADKYTRSGCRDPFCPRESMSSDLFAAMPCPRGR